VVVIDPTRGTMALIVIGRPACAIVELNAIIKIYKYIGLYEGHHFIPMVMEVHNAPECDMDRFFKECARLFHNR
jgi:presenilin-like A22 family membrane protease